MNILSGISIAVFCLTPLIATAGEKVTYLALGDSVAFGYDPNAIPTPSNYSGYPEKVAALSSPLKWEANLSCPGQTSGSFLNVNAPEASKHCEGPGGFKALAGLHTFYTGSQMAEALFILNAERQHIKAVTLNIGGNDLILLQEQCLGQPPCILAGLDGVTNQLANNLATILGKLRIEGGYSGPIIVLTYYSPNYADPLQTGAIAIANSKMVAVAGQPQFRARIADGFGAFLEASGGDPCSAGLLIIKRPEGTCDVHPSPKGRDVLAAAVLGALGR